jgi:hypothetical protein
MIMFICFVWLIISIAGGVLEGDIRFSTTTLTANISNSATIIPVRSTLGFPGSGILAIGTEKIAYAATTPTSVTGSIAAPLLRGVQSTTAQAHILGDRVRTVESSMMNQSAQYSIALINDSSSLWSVVTVPLGVVRLLGSYMHPPIAFMGTNLQILIYVWWALMAGLR